MTEDNLLLKQMQGIRAFILYRLEPQSDGSLDKIPIDPYTGYPPVDATTGCGRSLHDPEFWMFPDEAQLWAEQYGQGYGVGVVISELVVLPNGLRLFCLDLDKCRDGDRWLPHAMNFCTRFAGSLIESSVSGNGLHVFGCYRGDRPNHGVKNKTYRMELYTRLRFIAVTGYGASGDALADRTELLQAFASEFFPPHDTAEYGDTLTIAPVSEWSGPEDDDELIRRMLRSHSAGAVFGGRAAFADLWNANANILARVFPAFKNTAWDESAADQALANHLAFWTGNHGERMERIMQRSQLKRWKWERPGYLVGTINRACGSQTQWYKDPHVLQLQQSTRQSLSELSVSITVPSMAQAIPTPSTDTMSAGDSSLNPVAQATPALSSSPPVATPGVFSPRPTVGDYLTLQQQISLFEGCVYVQDVHKVMMPQGYTLDDSRFNAEFSGYTFAVTADGSRPARRAWDAFVYSEVCNFPKVKGTFFDPRSPPRTIVMRDGWSFINSWVPIEIFRQRGDVSPFLNHIKRILPRGNDAEILISYFAACVQFPGIKFQWWPLIQGVEGNGKTLLSRLLAYAIGSRYTHWPKASEVGSKFNAAFYGKILVCVEDVYISEASGSLWETLKPMITSPDLEVESKGVDKVMREVCFNGVLNSNHKNGVRKTRNDRRICPFFCAQQNKWELQRDGLTKEYFIGLRDWIANGGNAAVADYLNTVAISSQWNPAADAIVAPDTSATEDAITAGLGSVEQEVLEAVEQGVAGFKGGWISSAALDRLLGSMGKVAAIPRNKRRELLQSLGYQPHPALPEGRSSVLDTDGSRPRLYVRNEAPGALETNPITVMQWYQYCQQQEKGQP